MLWVFAATTPGKGTTMRLSDLGTTGLIDHIIAAGGRWGINRHWGRARGAVKRELRRRGWSDERMALFIKACRATSREAFLQRGGVYVGEVRS